MLFLKMVISLETSSQNGGVGGYLSRRVLLNNTISLETSSESLDVENFAKFTNA